MSEKPVRVLIVDDQVLMRRGLVELLGRDGRVEVVGEAEDGVDALRKVASLTTEVALVDARMPRMDGIELIRHLGEDHPGVAAVILTTFDDDEYILGGLEAGARGYLLKDTPPDELGSAIEKASRGETVLGGQIASRVVRELQGFLALAGDTGAAGRSPDDAPLSEREVEVARLVGRGASNAELARELYISEGTAKNHVSKILRKLDLKDRTQLVIYATQRGWTGHH